MSNEQSGFAVSKQNQRSNELWVERYRPQKLSDMIIPDRLRHKFSTGLTQNIIIVGTHGTGKTTLAKILAKGRSVLEINASLDNGIDVVRSQIYDFASTNSLINHGQKKIVLLDEVDNFTEAGQKSLRGFIEKFHKNVIFIMTANFPEKIIEPLSSRLTTISFDFTDAEAKSQLTQYVSRMQNIAKQNGYQIHDAAIAFMLKSKFPDLRAMIGDLQSICEELPVGSAISLDDVNRVKISKFESLYEFLLSESKPDKIYSYVKSNFVNKEIDALHGLSSDFLTYLVRNERHSAVLPVAAVSHKYNYEARQSIDKFVTLLACCGAVSDILRKSA